MSLAEAASNPCALLSTGYFELDMLTSYIQDFCDFRSDLSYFITVFALSADVSCRRFGDDFRCVSERIRS